MKKTTLAIVSLLVLLVVNCKENKKEIPNDKLEVEQTNKDFFTLTINAIVENDDTFTLFYLEGEQKQISDENSVSVDVIGSNFQQTLQFKLKEDVLPTRLILRYGNMESGQKIEFFDSEITYYDNEIFIAKHNFYQFFIPNKYIEFNQETHVATSNPKVDKNGPVFYSRKVLDEKIDFFF